MLFPVFAELPYLDLQPQFLVAGLSRPSALQTPEATSRSVDRDLTSALFGQHSDDVTMVMTKITLMEVGIFLIIDRKRSRVVMTFCVIDALFAERKLGVMDLECA